MPHTFSSRTFKLLCNKLASADAHFASILQAYGYPPMWSRPNSFETLVHIILEQQVSLASALSALKKLQEKTKSITPRTILALSDEEMRACYVSRQKTVYLRHLAEALIKKQLVLEELAVLPDEQIRAQLTALKGIGNWTTDIYLIFALQRSDVFPVGDLAAVNALRRIKGLDGEKGTQEKLLQVAEAWRPYRSIATMLLWHFYLSAPRQSRQNTAPVTE